MSAGPSCACCSLELRVWPVNRLGDVVEGWQQTRLHPSVSTVRGSKVNCKRIRWVSARGARLQRPRPWFFCSRPACNWPTTLSRLVAGVVALAVLETVIAFETVVAFGCLGSVKREEAVVEWGLLSGYCRASLGLFGVLGLSVLCFDFGPTGCTADDRWSCSRHKDQGRQGAAVSNNSLPPHPASAPALHPSCPPHSAS